MLKAIENCKTRIFALKENSSHCVRKQWNETTLVSPVGRPIANGGS